MVKFLTALAILSTSIFVSIFVWFCLNILIFIANIPNSYGYSYKTIAKTIFVASKDFNVPSALVLSIIKEESDFNINALSDGGAIGLMQLMPRTAKSIGINPYNPLQNIIGGVYYLRYCLNLKNENIALALACYNAGPNGGVPYSTYKYIKKVAGYYQILSK
jgi:soluble lytic murein transglycosylase-like protein